MTNQQKKNLLYTEKMQLEDLLGSRDYRNTKNGENKRANLEMPYDPVTLHEQNQAYRDRINEIEEEIKNIPDDPEEKMPEEE